MNILLASVSPRRAFLLSKMGMQFTAVPSNYVEQHDETRSVQDIVEELGLGKANAVAAKHPDCIVIGGDTIVAFEGKQLGKATDEAEARATLQAYSGKSCQVVSSVAVVSVTSEYAQVASDSTTILFGTITDQMIDDYIATGDYVDKGGSFALQHPLCKPMITGVEGRIDTVIGLPTHLLADMLRPLGMPSTAIEAGDTELLRSASLA